MTRLTLSLLVLLATGCLDYEPPPFEIVCGDSVPEADCASWKASGDAWNAVVGQDVYVPRVSGDCGHVYIRRVTHQRGEMLGGKCNVTIEYRDGWDVTAQLHELGHVLLTRSDSDHREGSVMSSGGGGLVELTAEDGAAVRERWGMD
jgi:hypothetical protein